MKLNKLMTKLMSYNKKLRLELLHFYPYFYLPQQN